MIEQLRRAEVHRAGQRQLKRLIMPAEALLYRHHFSAVTTPIR
jgi:hypothetical protein